MFCCPEEALKRPLPLQFGAFIYELAKQCPIKHLVKAEFLLTSPMVRDPIVRPIIGTDFLAKIPTASLVFTNLRLLSELLLTEARIELLAERVERCILILRLFAVLLRYAGDACGEVRCPARTVSLVDVLATSTLSSHEVQPDLLLVHHKLTRHLWHHDHNGRA